MASPTYSPTTSPQSAFCARNKAQDLSWRGLAIVATDSPRCNVRLSHAPRQHSNCRHWLRRH
eukprot:3937343-Rhodomonas_salina.1